MKRCFVLLIGINDYVGNPLFQCVADVENMEKYCLSIKEHFDELVSCRLLNEEATKGAIVKAILNIVKQLKDTDTFLFYFSGHGAQEANNGRFVEEADDLLECLVTYNQKEQPSNYLLADKELSYLLASCPTNPHILTVFDCCHSGDMLRSEKQLKRISHIFPARPYTEFIFAEDYPEKTVREKRLNQHFSLKNSIHVAACQSNQSAWEGVDGGVFTNYLLQLLKQTKNQLNYQFLVQWAKLTLQDHNSESQIPTLSVQGTGSLSAQSNWLGIYDKEITQGAQLVYHPKNDWQLTLGQLMGIQEGTALKILLNSKKTMPAKVIKVGVDFAKVELGKEVKEQLDNKKIYPVIIPTLYSPLKIYLHDIDENTTQKELVQQSLQGVEEVSWSTPKESQFYLNIFNQMVYFSLPNTPFQPLNHQLPLAIKKATLENSLMEDIIALKKWNHFHTLYHPNQLTNTPKIKVELIDANTKKVIDILDGVHTLKALPERAGKEWAAKFQIKVTNSSTQDLYIAVLTLGSDMSITAKPFYNQSILLPPQKTKYFYDFEPYHRMAQCSLDTYKEVYNWPYEWFYYKFIVTEAGDFSASIPSFLQQGFYPPRLIGNPMGAVDRKQHLNQENYWAVYTSTIHLKNPTYNEISGHLAEQLDEYLAEDRIAPFLKKVYPDDILINQ